MHSSRFPECPLRRVVAGGEGDEGGEESAEPRDKTNLGEESGSLSLSLSVSSLLFFAFLQIRPNNDADGNDERE